jgi:tetratricopeptide (TPR) repeat protein
VAKDLLTDKDSPGEEDLVSPLQGKSLPRVVVTIAVAIAVPGGLYLLAALVVLPLITRYLLRRAEKRKESGELKKALTNANRAVRLSRKSATALAHRGLVHIEAGDLDSALADAELAIKRKPKVALPYLVRALVFDARGEDEAARANYDAFLERHRDKDNSSAEHARERVEALGG